MNDPHPSGARPMSTTHSPHTHATPVKASISGVLSSHHAPVDEEPLELVGEPDALAAAAAPLPSKIRAFADGQAHHERVHDWKRTPIQTGFGAVRMKSFHGKYSDQGLEYLDEAVNTWLDAHPEAEIKFVTSTVGTFEGKIREPALVLNLWY